MATILNGKLVTLATHLYSYKSYLKLLMRTGTAGKEACGTSQLFYRDDDDVNSTDSITGGNHGLLIRGDHTGLSRSVDMCGPLYEDVMESDKFLINEVDMQIKLYPSKPEFNIMSNVANKKFKIILEDVYLRLCKIRPTASIITGHANILATENAVYPYIKTDLRALNGDYEQNPFNFRFFDIATLGLYVNGESLPAQQLKIIDGYTIPGFQGLFDPRHPSSAPNIKRKMFRKGYALFQFTLEPYYGREFLDQIKRGNIRLQLQFSKALPETVSCLVYAEEPQLVKVDRARNILIESSSVAPKMAAYGSQNGCQWLPVAASMTPIWLPVAPKMAANGSQNGCQWLPVAPKMAANGSLWLPA
ncbi:uncharacterized protein F54H12.2-like [Haliotis asinina]|uniref:uncharacterized protein F54H12.2-like n=1 Tax=Haliotis asinina TaxID=109174 RepID=UPI0035324EE0